MGPLNGEYGQVSEWLERQQRRIAELEAENRELRRQLEALRRGVGVAVVIGGRTFPLAAQQGAVGVDEPPTLVAEPAHRPKPARGEAPAVPYRNTASMPAVSPRAKLPPREPAAQAAGGAGLDNLPPFPEDGWLTGTMRAVTPGPRRAPAGRSPSPSPSPSPSITPAWLRDEPAPEPSAWDEAAARASGAHTYDRPRVRSRPLAPRLEPVQFPTLAQLTGQHQAVRRPARPEQSAPQTPLSDSFLLG